VHVGTESAATGESERYAMKQPDYHSSITADITPEEAVEKISRVSEWWGTHVEGMSRQVEDVFTVRFAGGDMYKVRVAEVVPDERMVWEVMDARQVWVKDPTEWVGTRIVWEISSQARGTQIDMTHIGLGPELECYEQCTLGWNYLINSSLSKFLTDTTGLPVT
jgi:Activator of Hsp90 ATPase homolog 1-like protein